MRLTELCQPWLRPFVSAPLWCCLSSALLVISLHSSFKDWVGACRWTLEVAKEIFCLHFCLLLTDPLGVEFLASLRELLPSSFFFSLKEPTANESSHSTQRSQQDSLLSYEILRNGHITSYLGPFSDWLSSFLAESIVSLHPLHVVQLTFFS